MMPVRYVNNRGHEANMAGSGVWCDSGEWQDWAYEYSTMNGRVSSFRRGITERELTFIVVGPSREAAADTRNRLYSVMSADIADKKAGRLYVGEWFVRCWCIESKKDDYWISPIASKHTVNVLMEDPAWMRERSYDFYPTSGGTSSGLDYPFDFEFDFSGTGQAGEVAIESVRPCAVSITVFGPATNPRVEVGGNAYEVDVTVPDGGILFIDGLSKTVEMRTVDGVVTNEYGKTPDGYEGSGDYIFERLGPGLVEVSWPGTFGFRLDTYEAADERPWI